MKNLMKKMFAVILVLAVIMSVAACGNNGSSGKKTGKNSTYAYLLDTTDLKKPNLDLKKATGKLKAILDNGVLTIATSPDYPAAEFITEDGTIYGSEMMLAKYIADCLGVDLKIETMDFSSTMAAVDTGKTDLGISGYGWKKDRAENYELSIGYIGDPDEASFHTLICPAGQEDNYNTYADFIGKHIMAQANSLQQMYVEDQILALDSAKTTELEFVATLDQAILGLAAGKCDAVAMDGDTAQMYVDQSEGQFAMTGVNFDLSLYDEYEGTVMMAKKGETEFMGVINQILETVKENGYYGQFYKEAKKQAGID